jgi:hypothetical protein
MATGWGQTLREVFSKLMFSKGAELAMEKNAREQSLVLGENLMDCLLSGDRKGALKVIEELEVLLMVEVALFQALTGEREVV